MGRADSRLAKDRKLGGLEVFKCKFRSEDILKFARSHCSASHKCREGDYGDERVLLRERRTHKFYFLNGSDIEDHQ